MKTILYHGSYTKIPEPIIKKERYAKDFGEGFYCTNLKNQAVKWANKYEQSILNIYEYEENKNLKIKEFKTMDEEWLDFIISSRKGETHDYDIVIGAMADDQIYNYITDLIDNVITREAFWVLAKFKYPTHQIAFCTKKALECIKFKEGVDCKNE